MFRKIGIQFKGNESFEKVLFFLMSIFCILAENWFEFFYVENSVQTNLTYLYLFISVDQQNYVGPIVTEMFDFQIKILYIAEIIF